MVDDLGPWVDLVCRGKAYEHVVKVSPEDYLWAFAQGNWFITHGVDPAAKSYPVRSGKGRLLFLHVAVLIRSFELPPSPAHVIADHWNGDSFDARRKNLRWATFGMNARNIYGFDFNQLRLDL